MATYEISVTNEDFRPVANIAVEAISLNSWPTVSQVQTTKRNGTAAFTGLTGPHFFRPRHRRTQGEVGDKHFIGVVRVQVVKSSGEGLNVDYVVDSNGMGTHTTLFGTAGALEAAIATGGSRTIWLCTSHVETVAAQHDLSALATNQQIVVLSAGFNRPVISVAAGLGANSVIIHDTANSGTGSVLRFQGFSLRRDTGDGASAGPILTGDGGWQLPELEYLDIDWEGNAWNYLLWFESVLSASLDDIRFIDCRAYSAITSLIRFNSASATVGEFVVNGCDFASLDSLSDRAASTSVDPGISGISIEGNLFRIITGYAWKRTFNYPFKFNNNIVLDYQANASLIEIGTAGTTSPVDATIDANYIRCSNATGSASAVEIDGGAGTAENISVAGNTLRGPGNSVAIRFNIANQNCLAVNAYRDWTTTVGGTVGPGTGTLTGDHGSLLGLADDDHPQYLLLAGRGAEQDVTGGLTISTYLRVGNAATPTNITAGDLTAVRLILPDHALVARLLDVQDIYTATLGGGAQITASIGAIVSVGAGGATDELRGQSVQIEPRPTANYAGGVYGQFLRIVHDTGAFNINDARVSYQQLVQNLAGTTLTTGHALLASYRAQAGTITTAYGLRIERGAGGDAGAIGTGIGIEVLASTGVTPTLDIAIRTLGGEHRYIGHTMLGANVAPVASLEVRGAIDSAAARGVANLRLGSLSGDGAVIWEGSSGGMWDARNNAGTLKWGRTGVSFDVDFESTGVEIANSLRVGALTAPTNTTAGDLTCTRLFVGDATAVAGVEALISGDLAVTADAIIGSAAVPDARLHVFETTLGDEVFRIQTAEVTGLDPREQVFQNVVRTTDATVTTLHTIAITSNRTYHIEARIQARRTGGTAGTADDGAGYIIEGTYKTAAGTVTLIGALTVVHVAEDQPAWDATLTISGTNVLVRVTGAANNNVTWHGTIRAWLVET